MRRSRLSESPVGAGPAGLDPALVPDLLRAACRASASLGQGELERPTLGARPRGRS